MMLCGSEIILLYSVDSIVHNLSYGDFKVLKFHRSGASLKIYIFIHEKNPNK
jgi:hypothetical protein